MEILIRVIKNCNNIHQKKYKYYKIGFNKDYLIAFIYKNK